LNLSSFWSDVAEWRRQLSEKGDTHHLVSLDNSDGAQRGLVSIMPTEAAARAIANKRARLATADEIAVSEAENLKARDEIQRAEHQRLRAGIYAQTPVPSTYAPPVTPAAADKAKTK
jgi:hypothetical protein